MNGLQRSDAFCQQGAQRWLSPDPDRKLADSSGTTISKLPLSLLRLTVDEKGIPRDICVCKEAGLGLDKEAVNTVAKYRFEPGMLSGKPIPVHIAIQVDFGSF